MGSTYHSVHVHVIFTCKDRRPLITPDIQSRIYKYLAGICRKRNCHLVEGGGVDNHVHLLIGLSMTNAIADLLRDVKANSSRWVHETWPKQEFGWQDGYAAFSVSVSMIARTRKYIRNQEEHHKKHSLEDELHGFLKMHGMMLNEDGSVSRSPLPAPDDSAAPDGAQDDGND
jgi:REP element-mobilizing transposase RayT